MSTWGTPTFGDTSWDDPAPDGGSTGGTGGGASGGGSGSTGSGGSAPPSGLSLTGPSTASPGDTITLSFSADGATSFSIAPDVGPVTGSSVDVVVTTTTTFRLYARNAGGIVSTTHTVTVHGASAENIRYHQIRRNDREGNGPKLQASSADNTATDGWAAFYDKDQNVKAQQPRGNTTVVQLADQTAGFTEGHLLEFDGAGNARDSQVRSTDVVAISGGGLPYAQVPRGTVNGVNPTFTLDYPLALPWSWLMLNGNLYLPSIQGDPDNPGGTMPTPGGVYEIIGRTLTITDPSLVPRIRSTGNWFYIWYYRGINNIEPPTPPSDPLVASATVTIWTAFSGPSTPHGYATATYFAPDATQTGLLRSNVFESLTNHTTTIYSGGSGFRAADFSGASVRFFIDGTLGDLEDNYLDIYDVYLTLTFVDSTTAVVRPGSFGFYAGTGDGTASWLKSHVYNTGDRVLGGANVFECTVAGTSGSIQPSWPGSGTVTDNTVTWSFVGAQSSVTGIIANPANAFNSDTNPPTTYARFSRYNYASLAIPGWFSVVF